MGWMGKRRGGTGGARHERIVPEEQQGQQVQPAVAGLPCKHKQSPAGAGLECLLATGSAMQSTLGRAEQLRSHAQVGRQQEPSSHPC